LWTGKSFFQIYSTFSLILFNLSDGCCLGFLPLSFSSFSILDGLTASLFAFFNLTDGLLAYTWPKTSDEKRNSALHVHNLLLHPCWSLKHAPGHVLGVELLLRLMRTSARLGVATMRDQIDVSAQPIKSIAKHTMVNTIDEQPNEYD